jgi:hypothetical protein
VHHTKDKGDLAVAKTILDLTERGHIVFSPTITEHCRYDLIADINGKLKRIQVKYLGDGHLSGKTSWNDKHGAHSIQYTSGEFELFALYLAPKNTLLYCPFIQSFTSMKFTYEIPNSYTHFYWWEDFKDISYSLPKKRSCKDFGVEATTLHNLTGATYKIDWPSDQDLKDMVWNEPTCVVAQKLGVTDSGIGKYCKTHNIPKPPRGYWAKKKSVGSIN